MWNRLLEKSGFTEKDNSGKNERYLMSTQTNRKYFRTEFSKYDNELAKYLMNQRTPLDRVYRDWSDEYLDKEYAKGVKYLLVFDRGKDPKQPEKNKQLEEKITESDRLSPEKVQEDIPGDEEKFIKMLNHPKVREALFQIKRKEYDRLKRNKNQRTPVSG